MNNNRLKFRETAKRKREIIFSKYKDFPLSLCDCIDLLDRGHVYPGGSVYLGTKNVKMESAAKMLAPIGFGTMPPNTIAMRNGILEKIKQNRLFAFQMINSAVKDRIIRVTSTRIEVSKTAIWFRTLLDFLKYEYGGYGDKVTLSKPWKCTVITKGSFFINDQWIHVG